MADRTVSIDLLGRDKTSAAFGSASRGANKADKSFARVGRTMAHVGRIAAAGLVAGLGAAVLGAKSSIEAASNLNETMSKAAQIFGKEAIPALEKFGETAATTLGESKQAAIDGASTFAIMGKSAGLSGEHLVKFSTGLTSLAGDLASFHNASPEDAITAIGAAMRGEQEPIRKFGVLLDDASLRAEAVKQGLIKTTKEALTPQQKVLAAHALILKQTSDAQGDFARTSGGLANQQRILTAQLDNTKASLGAKLLPIVVKVATALNGFIAGMQKGTGAGGRLAGMVRMIVGAVKATIPVVKDIAQWIGSTLVPVFMEIGGMIGPQIVATFKSIGHTISSNKATWSQLENVLHAVALILTGSVVLALKAIGPAFKALAFVLKNLVIPGFKLVIRAVLNFFGIMIHGAAKALGWIPGLGGKLKKADAAFQAFKTHTLAVMDGIEGKAYHVGANFTAGLAKGIEQGGKVAVAAALGVARKVTAATNAGFQNHSPSKVGIKIGGFFSEGIAIGITMKGKKAVQAAKDLVDQVKSHLADLKSTARDIASSAADSVRGILDISQVGASGTTPRGVLAGFAAQAQAFAKALAKMAKIGLAPAIIAAVAAAGPSALGAANAFAAESKASVRAENAASASIDRSARQVGATARGASGIDRKIDETNRLLRQLHHVLGGDKVASLRITKGGDLIVDYVNKANHGKHRRGQQ